MPDARYERLAPVCPAPNGTRISRRDVQGDEAGKARLKSYKHGRPDTTAGKSTPPRDTTQAPGYLERGAVGGRLQRQTVRKPSAKRENRPISSANYSAKRVFAQSGDWLGVYGRLAPFSPQSRSVLPAKTPTPLCTTLDFQGPVCSNLHHEGRKYPTGCSEVPIPR